MLRWPPLILTSVIALNLVTWGCGSQSTLDVQHQPGDGARSVGGEGGEPFGPGVAGSGGAAEASPTCSDVAGSYSLERIEQYSFYGGGPWVWIRDDEQIGCTALVSTSGFPAQRYDVALSADAVVLTPITEPSLGGDVGTPEPSGHHLTEWNEITLPIIDASLTGTATASVKWSYDEEDIFDMGEETIEVSLRAASPATAAIEAVLPPWNNDNTVVRRVVSDNLDAAMLPWAAVKVMVSRPTAGISDHLVLPPGWEAVDVEDGHGVREALVSFSRDWEEVQGHEVSISLEDLLDISGMPVTSGPMSISVIDAGTPWSTHDMTSTDTLTTLSGRVEPYLAGACADTGCLKLDAFCGDRTTVAGQILLEGHSEIALRMRTDMAVEYPEDPAFYGIEFVAEDGTRLSPSDGGTWNTDNPEQLWVYDAAGHSKVGFSVSTTRYCHGWGGPLILDDISAR